MEMLQYLQVHSLFMVKNSYLRKRDVLASTVERQKFEECVKRKAV
ncbi:hypothetical protein SAMN05192550_1975 [Flavobacterium glycines]|uniref:Uncharacterized protein n=1 Tax=Flavobacterium glycines TaxID=551990 RepID=A0A1G8T166_9FLAO|nr:hypothetical protein SAMN05192550_1975 [Flavobacterium glycines]